MLGRTSKGLYAASCLIRNTVNRLGQPWRQYHLSRRSMSSYSVEQRGSKFSSDFRLFIKEEDMHVSAMHDIPLVADASAGTYNMVVEVPRWSNAKMEISLEEKLNPIKQDVKKGKVRFVANCFPHKGYIWNYGALPQTWEDPNHVDETTKCKGDGDPIDVCEIGQKIHKGGSVIQVKVLGTLAMIDEGETDWKILAIDVTDPMADKLNSIQDIEEHMPGFLDATVQWFRVYKIPDGKPANEFAFNAEPQDKGFAEKIISECNMQFIKMMSAKTDPGGISRTCTKYVCPTKISVNETAGIVTEHTKESQDSEIPEHVDKWHYVKA